MTTDNDAQNAAALRNDMATAVAATCAEWGFPLPVRVEAALRTAPRHLFAPEVSLEAAYAVEPVEVKRDEHGVLISTMSSPDIQAMQLVQADIQPGMRVLEVGSGGYFASLLAELVGPTGHVTDHGHRSRGDQPGRQLPDRRRVPGRAGRHRRRRARLEGQRPVRPHHDHGGGRGTCHRRGATNSPTAAGSCSRCG
ncbi:hypothetical protein GCM10020220_059790 [Nonomuraea rubra]